MTDPDEPRITLAPSPVRRALATASLGLPGAALFWIAAEGKAGSAMPGLVSLALGAAALAGAVAVWRAMRGRLVLTAAGLRDDAGRMLLPLSDIARVETGVLSLKPSGGFLLHLSHPHPMGWVPGLWWRRGRRMGVGGAVNRAEAKAMAEAIAALMAARAIPEEASA